MLAFVVPGPPLPWQRARLANDRRSHFNTEEMVKYQRHIGAIANAAALQARDWDPSRPVKLTVRVYRRWNRGDLSNFVKQVEDALNHTHVWEDDRLVHEHSARMFVDAKAPRIEVEIEPIESGAA